MNKARPQDKCPHNGPLDLDERGVVCPECDRVLKGWVPVSQLENVRKELLELRCK